jgi:hypothetical protein
MRARGTPCIRCTAYRSEEDTPGRAAMGNPERCLMGWRSQPQGRQAKRAALDAADIVSSAAFGILAGCSDTANINGPLTLNTPCGHTPAPSHHPPGWRTAGAAQRWPADPTGFRCCPRRATSPWVMRRLKLRGGERRGLTDRGISPIDARWAQQSVTPPRRSETPCQPRTGSPPALCSLRTP